MRNEFDANTWSFEITSQFASVLELARRLYCALMLTRLDRFTVHILLALVLGFGASGAEAQPWTRFEVPDSALAGAVRGADFENAWNSLLVAMLRSDAGPPDSTLRLTSLARRVAANEQATLGSALSADALSHVQHWSRPERRARIAAAVEESLATAALGKRQFESADSLLRSALERYRTLRERRRAAWVLGSLGVVTFQRGDYLRADSIYREALVARRAIRDARMTGNTLNVLGSTNYLLGRDSVAFAYLVQARAVREGTGERAALGSTLNYMGLVAARLGRHDEASDYYAHALELTVANGDSARTADVLTNFMNLLIQRGRTTRALELADRARVIYQSRGELDDEAQLELNVANVMVFQGRLSEAADRLVHAADLSIQARDVRGQLRILLSLGRVAVVLRDPERWQPPLTRALVLADSLDDMEARAASRNNLAVLLLYANDLSGARRLAFVALDQARNASDSVLVHDVATTLGNVAFAARDSAVGSWYQLAEVAGRGGLTSVRASDFNNLGAAAVVSGRVDDAEGHFRRALETAEDGHHVEWIWPALLGLGEVAERRGDFSAALTFARRAAMFIDTLRTQQNEQQAITLFASRLFAYDALIHLLGKLDARFPDSAYAAEAFLWSERARARALLDLVGRASGTIEPIPPVSLAQAQALLGPHTALLEYSLGDSSSTLWVVTRDAMRHVILPMRSALRARVDRMRRGLADPSEATSLRTVQAAHELYRLLIAPAEPLLRGCRHVIVSPDGSLAWIPFEALVVHSKGNEVRAADYLIRRFAISYTPSVTMLAARRAAGSGTAIIALADPRYFDGAADSVALPRLPQTASEIVALRAAAGNSPMVALSGGEATRTRLFAAGLERARIVHIATHGEVDEVDPQRCGLWLAAEGNGPGFLSVADVLRLDLDSDLVTLSACETGLGRLERGEGVVGLARAFMAAGSRSVLMSLWKVDDRSAAVLMTQFYSRMLKRGLPRDEALAEAKRALLSHRDTRSPFHWAPFVLMGQAGVLSPH